MLHKFSVKCKRNLFLHEEKTDANDADDCANHLTHSDFLMEQESRRGDDENRGEGEECLRDAR